MNSNLGDSYALIKFRDKNLLSLIKKFNVRQLWVATLIVGVFAFVNTHPIRPHDFWWHMALGREILTTGRIPVTDVYSHTMINQTYASYQMFWLADIGIYSLYSLGGPALVIFIQAILVTSTYLLLTLLCWQKSQRWGVTTLALFFAAALGIHNWNVRPQTISYLIGVFFLYAIYSYRKHPKRAWLFVFPLGMMIWANSHGSFPIGFLLLGIWLADEIWQSISLFRSSHRELSIQGIQAPLLSLLLTILACLINPRGPGIFSYVLNLSSNPVIQNLVPEWAPPTFTTQIGIIFFLGFLFVSTVMILSPRRPSFFQIITFLIFGLLALVTTRGVIWFGMVMAPVIADILTGIAEKFGNKNKEERTRSLPIVNVAFLIVLILISIFSLPWFKHLFPFPKPKSGLISYETPVEATQFLLDERPKPNLFNEIGFGSYLIWNAYPNYKVFVDPRIELYSPDIWRDYIALINTLPGWEQILGRYDINTVIVDPGKQASLVNTLNNSPEWGVIFEDQVSVIYQKLE